MGYKRHIRALMYKNYINWKRAWIASLIELLIPVLVTGGLCYYKSWKQPEINDELQLLHHAYAQYPVTHQVGINWYPIRNYTAEHEEFLRFANITNSEEDFFRRNPQFFFPQQCYSLKNGTDVLRSGNDTADASGARNMTAIGIVRNHNRVEVEFMDQLKLILRQQYEYAPDVYHNFTFKEFEKTEIMDLYLQHPDYSLTPERPGLCFAVEIVKYSDLRYELHLFFNDQMEQPSSRAGIPRQLDPTYNPIANAADVEAFKKYMESGYAIVQNWVANTILRTWTGEESSIEMITVPNSQASFNSDPFLEQVLSQFLPIVTLFAFFTPVFRMTGRIVAEKETRVRESMVMMGLTETAYWLSWFLYWLLVDLFISTFCSLILYYWMLEHSNYFLIWAFFFCFGLALFGFVIFCQAFWQKAMNARIFSSCFYVATAALAILIEGPEVSGKAKLYASLIPTTVAFSLSKPLAGYEAIGIGLDWETAQSEQFHNYIFIDGLEMLILDFIVYTLIGIYIDNVWPREVGVRRSLFYVCDMLTPTYWDCFNLCRSGNKKSAVELREEYANNAFKNRKSFRMLQLKNKGEEQPQAFDTKFETKYIRPQNFEPPDFGQLKKEEDLRFLKIQDLKKEYANGFRAVDGINVRMYEGQIFALLGHNGAGKTTTISMLTGMVQPTDGFATVYGYDVFNRDLDEVRKQMGVCPQHDILFDLLTPEEHLAVFQSFKGSQYKDRQEKQEEIEKLLKDVNLADMRKTEARNLSGGSRRKLSVAIALCGNSKFIMLDEPTSGMDIQARRLLWDMLKRYKDGRIIILSTHYMDEADKLGDRIGIMSHGKLVCLGTSLFLKNRYGIGYTLTLEKQDKLPNNSLEPFLKDRLGSEVRKLSEIGKEITFQIPQEVSSRFKQFFEEFDQMKSEHRFNYYSISITTLEEVFLAVGDGKELKDHVKEKSTFQRAKRKDNEGDSGYQESPEEEGLMKSEHEDETSAQAVYRAQKEKLDAYSVTGKQYRVGFQNFFAMIAKRYILLKRGWVSILFEVLVPVLFVGFGFWMVSISFLDRSPPREIQTKLFPLPQRILVNREPVVKHNFTDSELYEIEALGEDYEFLPYQDNSVLPLINNLPSSYTLQTPYDFVYEYRNWTEDMALARETAKLREQGLDIELYEFDLFSQFSDDHFAQRLAGDPKPYRFGSYLVFEANHTSHQYKVINFVNTTSQDVAAAYPQFMYESILRTATGQDYFQFKLVTHPFPILEEYRDAERGTSIISLLFVVAVGFSLIPATLIGQVMHERESGLKHMQVISGMNVATYWVINVAYDVVKLEIPMILCCFLLWPFQLKDYMPEAWPVFWAYPLGVVPFTHATSFLFQKEGSAQMFTVGLNLVSLMIVPITVYIMLQFPGTAGTALYINYWARVIPSYNVAKTLLFCGTYKVLQRDMERRADAAEFPEFDFTMWTMNNMLGDLYFLLAHFVAGCVAIFLFEAVVYQTIWVRCFYKICKCCLRAKKQQFEQAEGTELQDLMSKAYRHTIDKDVKAEQERVASLTAKDLSVRVNKLQKVFKTGPTTSLTAVESVSFGLEQGECFALLGVNGAGKTTTFKTLINETVPTGGSCSIGGYNVQSQFNQARTMVGYCPQHNTLFLSLTVKENLVYFARIKGISPDIRSQLIDHTIKQLNLQDHRHKEAGTLSGGNKRKLQVAIALIGNPPIILLDEPSAGMDPEARRHMWKVIDDISRYRRQCSVILTTHSMEEAEALSTKVGIMVKGGIFKCFGSAQHIKDRYGEGYELEIKIKSLQKDNALIQTNMKRFGMDEVETRLSITDFKSCLENRGDFPQMLVEEVQRGGLGDELIVEALGAKDNKVAVTRLLDWAHVMEHGLMVIRKLAEVFGEVQVLEQYNEYFKLRVLKKGRSIGFLFGLIETDKEMFHIENYSAGETTLEQIFQMFAKMSLHLDEAGPIVFEYDPTRPERVRKNRMQGPVTERQAFDSAVYVEDLSGPNGSQNPAALHSKMRAIGHEQ